jgi:hypothetical protein
MLKSLGVIALVSLAATPCLAAQAEVYGAVTLAQLAKVLTDVRGVPAEFKHLDGTDFVLVDSQVYQSTGQIQVTGLLCDSSTPAVCRGLAFLEPIQAPDSAVSDAQLLALLQGFNFVNIHRADSARLAVSTAMIIDGGVTVESIDNSLGFFAAQVNLVKAGVAKLLPPAPSKGKGKGN